MRAKSGFSLACVCGLAMTLAGCGNSREAATRDLLDAMTRMADTLTTVKDKDSAVAARPKVMATARQIESLGARFTSLGDAPPEEKTELEAAYGPQLKAASAAMFQQLKRVMDDPELAAIMQPSLPATLTPGPNAEVKTQKDGNETAAP